MATHITSEFHSMLENNRPKFSQGHLNSIKVGSNQIPFTVWKQEEGDRHRHNDRKTYELKIQEVT